jgi:hypothetical protein
MKFEALIEEPATGNQWWEGYDEQTDNPYKWMMLQLNHFNRTLKPHENPRCLLKIKIINRGNPIDHDWKKSNLITIKKGNKVFDTYQCNRCGATGKRYGLSPKITIDAKCKTKKHRDCVKNNATTKPLRTK